MNKFEQEAYLILQTRRAAAEAAAEKNIIAARENAEFFANEVAIRSIQIDIAKADKKEQPILLAKQKELEAERKQILKKLGLSESDLKPKYTCDKCNDTGAVGGKPCKCFKSIVLYKMLMESGVQAKDLVSFKEFRTDIAKDAAKQKELAAYKKFLMDIAEKFPNQKTKTITVCGTTGAGKTFGAKCLLREMKTTMKKISGKETGLLSI